MKRSQGDYFSSKAVRGSSPTASLAADLSQNFHIDQRFASLFLCLCPWFAKVLTKSFSPQFATPRRSLFSASLLGNGNRRGKRDTFTRDENSDAV